MIAGTFSFGLLGGCGGRTNFVGSEEQAYGSGVGKPKGDGDGDGSTGDGDAYYGDGDGDAYYGDGDGFGPVGGGSPGGLPGDGDGDLIPPPPLGDGDGDVRPPPPPLGDGDGDLIFPGDGDGDGISPRDPLTGCEVDYRNQGSDYCDLSYQCDQGSLWTYCWEDGDQSYCDCEGQNGYHNIQVGAGTDVACTTAAEFCGGSQTNTGGMDVCETQYEDSGSDYCSSEEVCVSQGQTSGGVPVGVTSWNSTWCNDNGSDWNCQCWGQNGELNLNFTPSSEGITACREASAICNRGQFEFNGDLQCERDYQSASEGWCDVGLRCYQETVVDSARVSINAWAYASCQRQSDTAWACTCDGLGFFGGYSIEGTSSWDSCEDAGVMCARLIAEQ